VGSLRTGQLIWWISVIACATMKIGRKSTFSLLALMLAGVSASGMAEEKFTFLTKPEPDKSHRAPPARTS
jgi:hypothetical protein